MYPLSILLSVILLPSPQSFEIPDTLRGLESLIEFDPEIDLSTFLDDCEDLEPEPPEARGRREMARRAWGGEDRMTFGAGREDAAPSAPFAGSPLRWWFRCALHAPRAIDAGFMLEKDAGERADLGNWSGYLSTNAIIRGVRVTLGDYRFEPGSGLLFGRGAARMGAGGAFSRARTIREAIAPNRSRNEFGYFRGGAMEYAAPESRFALSVFAARRNLPGVLGKEGFVIERAGSYRTDAEMSRRMGTAETVYGFRGEFSPAGCLIFSSAIAVARLGEALDGSKYGLPSASRFTFLQADLRLFGENGLFAVDLARVAAQGWGAMLSWYRKFEATGEFLLRAEVRSRDFWDYRQTGSESNRFRLEWRAELPILRSVRLQAWISHWRRLRPMEGEFAPLRGSSCLIGVAATVSSVARMTLDLSRSVREEELTGAPEGGGNSRMVFTRTRSVIRPGIRLRLSRSLDWELKGAGVVYRRTGSGRDESGAGCTQQLSWSPFSWWSLRGWMTLYAAPSYDCAIYFSEPDPIRSVDLNPCYGEGERWGATCTFRFRGISMTIFRAAARRVPPGPAGPEEQSGSVGIRLNSPL